MSQEKEQRRSSTLDKRDRKEGTTIFLESDIGKRRTFNATVHLGLFRASCYHPSVFGLGLAVGAHFSAAAARPVCVLDDFVAGTSSRPLHLV